MQNSRINWLRQGDANITFFFHTSTLVRIKINRIDSLLDEQGVHVEDREQLKNLAMEFYKRLFTFDHEAGRSLMRGCFSLLDGTVKRRPQEGFSLEDTKKPLMSMEPLKALGPDGFQPIFFKSTWEVTGEALHKFTQRVLGGEQVSPEVDEALLVLIPKGDSPTA